MQREVAFSIDHREFLAAGIFRKNGNHFAVSAGIGMVMVDEVGQRSRGARFVGAALEEHFLQAIFVEKVKHLPQSLSYFSNPCFWFLEHQMNHILTHLISMALICSDRNEIFNDRNSMLDDCNRQRSPSFRRLGFKSFGGNRNDMLQKSESGVSVGIVQDSAMKNQFI